MATATENLKGKMTSPFNRKLSVNQVGVENPDLRPDLWRTLLGKSVAPGGNDVNADNLVGLHQVLD
jgi:hypothetical protein